jgi:hypothetical protein
MSPWATIRLLAVLGTASCGGDDDGGSDQPVADGGAAIDARPDAAAGGCSAASPPRAVVVGLNGEEDSIAVMTLEDGRIEDHGIRLPVGNPRGVAIRSDGAEAVVGYGGFGNPFGIVVVAIGAGGSSAEIVDTVEVGDGEMGGTPFGITYASDDHVVLALATPGDDGLLAAVDRGTGGFAPGEGMVIPDNWPLDVAGRPGADEVILMRAQLGSDPASDVFRVGRSGADWTIVGSPAPIGPPTLHITVHPGGDLVYGATTDPDDPVGVGNLDAPGVLHLLAIGEEGMTPEGTSALPGISSFGATDPAGSFLVLQTPVYEVDEESGTPIVRSYSLTTVELEADGAPGQVHTPTTPFPALLFRGFEVAAGGELVTSVIMYPDQAPPDEEYQITVWAQATRGDWEACQTIYPEGQAELAIAP